MSYVKLSLQFNDLQFEAFFEKNTATLFLNRSFEFKKMSTSLKNNGSSTDIRIPPLKLFIVILRSVRLFHSHAILVAITD